MNFFKIPQLSPPARQRWIRGIKLSVRILPLIMIAGVAAVLLIDRWVSFQADEHIYTDINQLPEFQVAVVLGTSKYLGKTLNEYYTHRIDAAISLYREENSA